MQRGWLRRGGNETLPDHLRTWDEAHKRAGQVEAAVVVVAEKGRQGEKVNIELTPEEIAYIIGIMKPELRNADMWLDWEDGGWQYNDEQLDLIRAEIGKYKRLLRRLEEALEITEKDLTKTGKVAPK